jgi:hypothetical protein
VDGYPRISAVEPLEGFRLRVTFANGVTKLYDCTPLLHDEVFESLRDAGFFKNVQAEPGGYAVVWNDQVDLSESEIWEHGI